jgi:PAS domain S-box-containing protein
MPFGYLLKPIQERDLKVTLEMALYIAEVDEERKKVEEKLRINENRMKAALEGTDEGIWDWDLVDNRIALDENWKQLHGIDLDEEDITFDWWKNSLDLESRPVFEKTLKDYLEGKTKYYEFEYRIKGKDGKWRWIWVKGIGVSSDEDGNVTKIVGTLRDISERKQTEQKLKESEEKYRKILDTVDDQFWRVDLEGKLKEWNKSTEENSDIPPDQMKNQEYEAYTDPTNRQQLEKDFTEVYSTGIPKQIELKQYRLSDDGKDTIEKTFLTNVHLDKDHHGNPIGYYGFNKDITSQKQIEKSLQSSEYQHRTTLDSMGDIIHVVDTDMNLVLTNELFRKEIQKQGVEDGVIGKNLFELFAFFPEGHFKKMQKEYQQVFDNGETLVTVEKTRIQDEVRYTETRKIPVLEDNVVKRVVTVIRDNTDQKRVEEKLREYEDKIKKI